MRDIVLEETIYMDFTTRSFSTGVPTVLSGTPVLSVLEENNATPITAGVSVSVDRASVVGLNMAIIVATAANGYEAGKGYSVYVSTGTVGGVSVVGEVVAQFTIDASSASQDLSNGTDGLTVLKAGIDAIPTTAMRGTDSAATSTKQDTMETTLNAIPTTPMRGTDSANTVVPPSVAQFNARTLLAADYFDFSTDNVIVGTNSDKTGYSISGTITTLDGLKNFDPVNDTVAKVTLVATTTAVTNQLSINVVKINGFTVLGDGTAGNLWRA